MLRRNLCNVLGVVLIRRMRDGSSGDLKLWTNQRPEAGASANHSPSSRGLQSVMMVGGPWLFLSRGKLYSPVLGSYPD